MESVSVIEDVHQQRNCGGFVPITPAKTLICTLNSAITGFSNSDVTFAATESTIRCDSVEDRSVGLNFGSGVSDFGNVFVNSSVLSGSGLCMGSNAGLEGASDVANQQSGVASVAGIEDEVILTPQKNKKQKVGPDLNRKPGEKRQNKYYWAKIDAPRPHTLAPKTPKVVTPKPPKSKTPKPLKPKTPKVATAKPRRKTDKKGPTECSVISEHVEGKPTIDSSRKRSLNFEVAMPRDLDPDYIPEGLVEKPVSEETTKDAMCTQGLSQGDGDIAVVNVKPDTKIEKKKVIVYRRKFNSKCLYMCQNLVPKVEENFKRKRLQRNKKSFGDLKKFEGFNCTCLVESLLGRILSVKGRIRMVLPTEVDLSKDTFGCVLSLLSSRPAFMMKKRLLRARRSTKQSVDQGEMTSKAACPSPTTIEPPINESNRESISAAKQSFNSEEDSLVLHGVNKDTSSMQLCTQQSGISSIPSTSKGPTAGHRGIQTNANKEKNPKRTYKRKGKENSYLSKLSDWHDLSAIMDDFALQFKSLKLNDDPKTWIVEVSEQGNNTDSYYEKIRLDEEKANLFKKIAKFLQEMFYYQGSKRFIKWNGSVLDSVVGVFLTQNVSDILSSNAYINIASKFPIKSPTNSDMGSDHVDTQVVSTQGLEVLSLQESSETVNNSQKVTVEHPDDEEETTPDAIGEEEASPTDSKEKEEYNAALNEMLTFLPHLQAAKKKGKPNGGAEIDWERIKVIFSQKSQRMPENEDSVDWEAVRKTNYLKIAEIIRRRGQHRIIAFKIQKTLNRLVKDHGSLDVEWLRDAPPVVAKAYLLSFYGLGLKSVECLRLLTLHHHGFPVDVNIGRIAIRLGWVPIKPLPPGMPFHLLQKYPLEDEIQKYLWPRLRHLSQEILYNLHYQMITFGKVFCQKRSPNCRACPFKNDCRYYASLSESWKQALPGPPGKKSKKSKKHESTPNPFDRIIRRTFVSLPSLTSNVTSCSEICTSSVNVGSFSQLATAFGNLSQIPEFFVEMPPSPKPEDEEKEEEKEKEEENIRNAEEGLVDIEDCCDGYTYHLKLTSKENKQTPLSYFEPSYFSSQNPASREMVSVPADAAFNPLPKQVNVSRLRTEHQVYELPTDNPLLTHLNLEMQVGEVPYLLAIWTPDQVEKTPDATSGLSCSSEGECISQEDSSTIPGTLLLPVRTAMRKSFPLNGTYFQMNEVFADYETSERPFNVPTNWIWNLKKRTLYCGSSASAIVKGTTEMEIQQCFREGFICTRGFSRKTRAPKPLPYRFHKRPKVKSNIEDEGEDDE